MDKFVMVVGAILLALVFGALGAAIAAVFVMLLWDWLMPALFGLGEITLLQAWGLSMLCHFLFKTTVSKEG